MLNKWLEIIRLEEVYLDLIEKEKSDKIDYPKIYGLKTPGRDRIGGEEEQLNKEAVEAPPVSSVDLDFDLKIPETIELDNSNIPSKIEINLPSIIFSCIDIEHTILPCVG